MILYIGILLGFALMWTLIGYEIGRHRRDLASERQFKLVAKRNGDLLQLVTALRANLDRCESELKRVIEDD